MQQHQHQQQHDSPLSHSQPSDASTSTPSALPYPYPPPPPNPAMAHFLQPQHQQPFYPPPSVPGTDPAALASIVQYLAQMVVSAASAVSTPHAQLHPHALPPPSMLPPTSVPSFAGLPPPPYSAGGHLGYQHPGKLPGADYGAPSSSHYSSLPPPSAYGHSAVPPDFGTLVQQHAASAGLSPEMLAAVTAATLPGVSTLLSSSEPLLSQSLPAATMALLANTTQPYRVDPLTGRPMDDMSMLTLDPSAYARSIIPPNTHLGHMDAAEFAALTSPSSSAGSPHSRGSPTYAPSLAQSTQSQSPPPSSGLSSAPGEYDGDGSEPRVRTPENTVVSMALAAALSANAAAITARNEYDSAGSISTTPTTAPPSSDIGLSKGKDAIDGGRAKVPKARRSGKVTKEEPGVSDQSSAIDTSKRIPPSPPMEGGANATEWSADRVSMLHNVHLPTPSSPLTIQPINPSQYPPISDVVAAAAAAATAAYQGVVSPHPLPPPPEVESAPSMTKAGPGSNLFQFTLSRPTSSGAGDEKRSKKGKGAASSPSGDTGTPEKDGDDQSGQEDGEGTTETRAPGKHQRKVAHNAIERRYRNNINNRIADLKRVVPALLHAKISKDKRRGGNADSDSDSDGSSDDSDGERRKRPGGRKGKAPVQLIDGIPVATKLNKATILRKATEYIVHLKGVTSRLGAENEALKALAGALPGGQEALAAYASAQAHILARESANAAVAEAASKEAEKRGGRKRKATGGGGGSTPAPVVDTKKRKVQSETTATSSGVVMMSLLWAVSVWPGSLSDSALVHERHHHPTAIVVDVDGGTDAGWSRNVTGAQSAGGSPTLEFSRLSSKAWLAFQLVIGIYLLSAVAAYLQKLLFPSPPPKACKIAISKKSSSLLMTTSPILRLILAAFTTPQNATNEQLLFASLVLQSTGLQPLATSKYADVRWRDADSSDSTLFAALAKYRQKHSISDVQNAFDAYSGEPDLSRFVCRVVEHGCRRLAIEGKLSRVLDGDSGSIVEVKAIRALADAACGDDDQAALGPRVGEVVRFVKVWWEKGSVGARRSLGGTVKAMEVWGVEKGEIDEVVRRVASAL